MGFEDDVQWVTYKVLGFMIEHLRTWVSYWDKKFWKRYLVLLLEVWNVGWLGGRAKKSIICPHHSLTHATHSYSTATTLRPHATSGDALAMTSTLLLCIMDTSFTHTWKSLIFGNPNPRSLMYPDLNVSVYTHVLPDIVYLT